MQGVGPGSVLGDRYVLSRPSARAPDHQMWLAHDQTLERPVAVIVVDAAHPGADAAMDAGRRAAAIEDTRLVRIFDVGQHDQVAYIVQEALLGAASFGSLIGQGGLPAAEVRRIIGESATALEVASVRGLHHQRLSPVTVGRLRDGSVIVTGLAVLAALAGDDGRTPAAASRTDAVALGALTYAGLTGRWGRPSPPGQGSAKIGRPKGRLAPPSQLVTGVPADLDALCQATLVEDSGPSTPGEVAAQLAPWNSSSTWQPREQTERLPPPSLRSDEEPQPASPDNSAGNSTDNSAATVRMVTPTLRLPTSDIVTGLGSSAGTGAGRQAGSDGSAERAVVQPPAAPAERPADQTSASGPVPAKSTAPEGGATAVVGSVLGGTRAAASTMGGRVTSLARAAAQQAAARTTRVEPQRATVSLPEVLRTAPEPEEPAAPLLGSTQGGRSSKGQSRTVVALLALFVLGALSLAYCNLSQLSPAKRAATNSSASSRSPSSSATGDSTASSSPSSSSPSPAASPSGPLVVHGARGFDPKGDGREMNAFAPRAYDNNPASSWTSEGYSSAHFGGLSKRGVGIVLDLGTASTVHQADLILPVGPTDVTLYASDDPGSIQNATKLGRATGVVGPVTMKAPADAPATRYVVVWFTKLVPLDGKYRAALSEIALR